MTTISLRMDDQMKKELDEMCEAMGMNISTFYMIYTKKALRDRRIPFDIEAPADPFYSEQNMAQLRKSAQQVKEGKIITKTMEDLEGRNPIFLHQFKNLLRVILSEASPASTPDTVCRSTIYGANFTPVVKIFPVFPE